MKPNNLTPIPVEITFQGTVVVHVPAGLTEPAKRALAQKLACAKALATMENPDGATAKDNACGELAAELGLSDEDTEVLWDACQHEGLNGTWSTIKETLENPLEKN